MFFLNMLEIVFLKSYIMKNNNLYRKITKYSNKNMIFWRQVGRSETKPNFSSFDNTILDATQRSNNVKTEIKLGYIQMIQTFREQL